MTTATQELLPTAFTVGEAWLIYRPVMDYEESETPYCICPTEAAANEVRAELVRFAEDLASKLPRYPTTDPYRAQYFDIPFVATEQEAKSLEVEAFGARYDALQRVAWPLGIDLSGDFEISYEVPEFKAATISIRHLPFVCPDNHSGDANKMVEPDSWTQEEPKESGIYWMWVGEDDSSPIPVNVMWSGHDNRCFVATGQWGWNRAQTMDELEGTWWKPCREPKLPSNTAQAGKAGKEGSESC